ncbi:ATPase, T2SS/T4P/T4SS family [Paraburkholderia megapolitana]|uniref:ATPase, T2SS/T4P/T4SS family n=1 Tax=Paraburkholderia megapolitana TaxID=420953 RepID=UPI0038BD7008
MLANSEALGMMGGADDPDFAGDGSIAALDFSDLYLEPDGRAWFKTYANDPVRHEVDGAARKAIGTLVSHLAERVAKRDFRLRYDGLSMRGARFETAMGGSLYVLRRHTPRALDFTTLGYGSRIERALLSREKRDGLYLFTGGTSSGKTVGATSLTVELMRRYGGAGYTIENPIEVEIEGIYSSGEATGTLYQKEIDDDSEFGPEIRRRMRGSPNLIMIGELRNADAVLQALLAATASATVIATYHAADQLTGLQRLASMVRDAGGDSGLFAHGLAAVIHQELLLTDRSGELQRQLRVTPLIVAGSRNEAGMRSQLHGTDFRQLSSDIDRQKRVMTSSSPDVGF